MKDRTNPFDNLSGNIKKVGKKGGTLLASYAPDALGFVAAQGILQSTIDLQIQAAQGQIDLRNGFNNFLVNHTGDFGDTFQIAAVSDIAVGALLVPTEMLMKRFVGKGFTISSSSRRAIRKTAAIGISLSALGVAEIPQVYSTWVHSSIGSGIDALAQQLTFPIDHFPDLLDIPVGLLGIAAWTGLSLYTTRKNRKFRHN